MTASLCGLVWSGLVQGVMSAEFLRRVSSIRASKLPSFILVAGDEPSDNKMFDVSALRMNDTQLLTAMPPYL